jgi:hypothetical protein
MANHELLKVISVYLSNPPSKSEFSIIPEYFIDGVKLEIDYSPGEIGKNYLAINMSMLTTSEADATIIENEIEWTAVELLKTIHILDIIIIAKIEDDEEDRFHNRFYARLVAGNGKQKWFKMSETSVMLTKSDLKNFSSMEEPKIQPTYKHKLASLALERQTSVCTTQGSEGTCYAHAGAKVMLQNIFLFVNPINVQDKEKFHSCFDVLKTDMEHDYTHLSVEKCGIGYFKILLFLYLYFMCKKTRAVTRQLFVFEGTLLDVVKMPDIEQFKGKIQSNFDAFRKRILHKIRSRELIWDTFTIKFTPNIISFLKDIIIPILNLGFYVYMVIQNPTVDPTHAVVLVKHRKDSGQDFFSISNSWGEEIDYTSDLTKIHLKGELLNTTFFRFVLPFCTKKDMPTTPLPHITPDGPIKLFSTPEHMRALLEWIPNYERDIQLFKSRSGGKKTKRKNKKRSIKKYLNRN